jgi:hypothetical protein
MSNRERIARKAEEARLAEAEKAAKRSAPKTTGTRSKRAAEPVRMKLVWEVCNATGKAVQTFPYPDKAAAEGAARVLSTSTGHTHILRATKVPMS